MENTSCILSTAYWGPVQYFSKIYKYPKVVIEQFETYPKQTYRNRLKMYAPNGIQTLSIPVKYGSLRKVLTKDVLIDYATNWQKNHLKSIEAAYKSSPFYDFYIDNIIPLYQKQEKYLIDLNLQIIGLVKEWIDFDCAIELTEDYIHSSDAPDFRESIHPKPQKHLPDNSFTAVEYIQGFEQRHGFVPNLSILDLIFNTGPEASYIILQSTK